MVKGLLVRAALPAAALCPYGGWHSSKGLLTVGSPILMPILIFILKQTAIHSKHSASTTQYILMEAHAQLLQYGRDPIKDLLAGAAAAPWC